MKKIFLLLTFFISIASLAFAQKQDATLSAKFSRDSLMIGEQVEWTLKATVGKSTDVFFPQIDTLGDGQLEILQRKLDTLQETSHDITLQQTYLLTSFDAGRYILPQIPVLLRRHSNGRIDTVYFDRSELLVKTVPIDTTIFKPYDVKSPINYPLTFKEMLPWLLLGLAIIALIAVVVYIIIRRRQHKPLFFAPKPKDPPHVIALRELEKIHAEKLWQNNKVKTYYTRVTDVLRVYIEDRYHTRAMEQTSEEILQALAQLSIPEHCLPKIRDFLSMSDLVKFAKYLPDAVENESAVTLIAQFITETKETEIIDNK